MRRLVLAAAVLASLAGCREGFFDPTPGQTDPQRKSVELVARNIRILAGEDNAVRIGFQPKDVSAHLRVERSSPEGRIIACPLRGIDDPIPAETSCLPDLPDGVREGLTLTGLGALVLLREGDPITLELRVEFEEAGRAITVRIPSIARPPGASACRDNACNPVFEVLPPQSGTFTATASWTGGSGRLEVIEGRVLARSFSSTGIPYRVAGQRSGASPLSVTATLSSPTEFALALINTSPGELSDIEIRSTWP